MESFFFQNGDRLSWKMYDGNELSRVIHRLPTFSEQLMNTSLEINSVRSEQWSVMLADYGYSDVIGIAQQDRRDMLQKAMDNVGWKKVISKLLWLMEIYNSDKYCDINLYDTFYYDYEWVKQQAILTLQKVMKPCSKMDYDTIIMNDYGTLIWRDDGCSQNSTPLKANNITLKYIIDSVMFYYKTTNRKPSNECVLDYLMYDNEKHIIYLHFGN